ncbi:MAG: FKBP-type peptidyl-prolyl cis-trans isomerase [Bacteroidales bacterium]
MKKTFIPWIAIVVVLPLVFTSCARIPEENLKEEHRKLLEAHVKIIHLDTLQRTESGLYYTVLQQGTGGKNTDSAMVFVRETIRDLQYNIVASTEASVARQLGTFSYARAYMPLLWHMGTQSILRGLEEMVLVMREGEIRRSWLPYWMSSYREGGSAENASAMVYDLELVKVIHDMDSYQTDLLEVFRNMHYPGVDSLEKGFYKITVVPGTGDTLKRGTSVGTYYVGKFLDGHVFDTNVADTALKYRIHEEKKDYGLFRVVIPVPEEGEHKDKDKNKEEEGSAIKGFVKCVTDMRYGEQAVCFFHSDYGYKEEGKPESPGGTYLGGGIPGYTPLYFWISVPLKQ